MSLKKKAIHAKKPLGTGLSAEDPANPVAQATQSVSVRAHWPRFHPDAPCLAELYLHLTVPWD